jgi:hypothetical protein
VLDGQQRLTSLLIGLRGSFTIKTKWKRWDDPAAWVRHHLYLDLLKDPRLEDESGDAGIRYGLKFLGQPPINGPDHHWIRVGRILDYEDDDRMEDLREEELGNLHADVPPRLTPIFNRNLNALYKAVWKEESISYYTETSQDYDRTACWTSSSAPTRAGRS